jgi:predicted alpha-1,6-mannanase (GH76 family)
MQDVRAAAPLVARALHRWYGADPYARKTGLYRYDDPSLAVNWKDSSRLGRNLASSVLAVTGQRHRVQDINRWWDSANAITAVIDYMSVTGDRSYLGPVVQNTFRRAPGARRRMYRRRVSRSRPYLRFENYQGFINGFYDDEGWWALAWISAYDLTGDENYLTAAAGIFQDMAGGWDDFWGGGIYWGKYDGSPDRLGVVAAPRGWTGGYKNAIANELFIAVAASLGLRYRRRNPSGPDHAGYARWAVRGWEWFGSPPPQGIAMINEANLVNDSPGMQGVNSNTESIWSYNQGVILSGLCDLSELAGDEAYLGWAEKIADAFIGNPWSASSRPSKSGVIHGILHERDDCRPDGSALATPPSVDSTLFKGIFVRNLARLYLKIPKAAYQQFILANVQSALAQANERYQFGCNWAAPVDVADFVRQTAGLDLVTAALLVTEPFHPPTSGPESAGSHEEDEKAHLVVHGALVRGVPGRLELEGGVLHVEMAAQAVLQPVEHAAVVDHPLVHHHVRREHREPGGDRPGVQVVHVADAGQAGHVAPDLAQVDAAGARLEQHVDGLPQQLPGAGQDQQADGERGDRVHPGEPGGRDHHPGHDHRGGPERVRGDLEEGAADIQALRLPPPQQQQRHGVGAQRDHAEHDEQPGAHLGGRYQPPDRLDQDERRHPEQQHGVGHRGQDLGPGVAEGAPRGGRPGGHVRGQQGQAEAGRVGGHVRRVGDQHQGAGDHRADDLGHRDQGAEHQGRDQGGTVPPGHGPGVGMPGHSSLRRRKPRRGGSPGGGPGSPAAGPAGGDPPSPAATSS